MATNDISKNAEEHLNIRAKMTIWATAYNAPPVRYVQPRIRKSSCASDPIASHILSMTLHS